MALKIKIGKNFIIKSCYKCKKKTVYAFIIFDKCLVPNNVTGPAIQFSTPKPQLLTLKLATVGHVMLNTVHCNVLGLEIS